MFLKITTTWFSVHTLITIQLNNRSNLRMKCIRLHMEEQWVESMEIMAKEKVDLKCLSFHKLSTINLLRIQHLNHVKVTIKVKYREHNRISTIKAHLRVNFLLSHLLLLSNKSPLNFKMWDYRCLDRIKEAQLIQHHLRIDLLQLIECLEE